MLNRKRITSNGQKLDSLLHFKKHALVTIYYMVIWSQLITTSRATVLYREQDGPHDTGTSCTQYIWYPPYIPVYIVSLCSFLQLKSIGNAKKYQYHRPGALYLLD